MDRMNPTKSTVTDVDPDGDEGQYARLSQVPDGKLTTTDVQLRVMAQDAKREGSRIYRTYVDDGISAWDPKAHRGAFLTMLRDIKDGKLKRVRAVRTNRFARQTGELDALIMLCKEHDVTFVAEGQSVDLNNPMAEAMVKISGVLNAMESNVKSISVKMARDEAARQGRRHGGHRPFGYNDDGMTPHPVEAPLYVELVERVARGESAPSIANDWAQRGVTSRTGRAFEGPRLRRLVQSPRHAGFRLHHGEIVREGLWEALVTPELQARAVAMLKSNAKSRRSPKGSTKREALLQGLVYCSACDAKLWINRNGSRSRYACPGQGGSTCGKVSIEMANVELEVQRQLLVRIVQAATRKKLAKHMSEMPGVQTILGRLDVTTANIAILRDMLSAGEIDMSDYRVQMRGLTASRKTDERALAAANTPVMLTTDPDTLVEKWDDLGIDERRANVCAMVERIVIHAHIGRNRKLFQPERVVIEWRY